MALATTSLLRRGSNLADTSEQLRVLRSSNADDAIPSFAGMLRDRGVGRLTPLEPRVLQINLGKMCNQACKHCHVDAGPDRTEIMSRETLEQCLTFLANSTIPIVDLTGGAPEMNPHFRWFVDEVVRLGRTVMVRCNLTIVVANPKYHDLPPFYAERGVHVVSSLPFYEASRTDRQRGSGVFADSITAMQMLNDVGYGAPDTGLRLDLVYNPVGAILPGPQALLEQDFKRALDKQHGVQFNSLICITNMPISRFLEFLLDRGLYTSYMQTLVSAFNPAAALGVMCRDTISVGWDGMVYDCDFNQMLDLPVACSSTHIASLSIEQLQARTIVVDQHCYGCTAGAGSSCGGQLT